MDGNEWMREDVQAICKDCFRYGDCPRSIVAVALMDGKCNFKDGSVTITDA